MSSSIGRIALGIAGAAIGAPFGLSAIGFSIGSAVGGMLFAPDGPDVTGPRLGDTSVSASSLGKVITEHYGVTRASGNMIWSAGLKEVKSTKSQGGKGGGGGSSTTFDYFASFAFVYGRGTAKEVRRIWADGKLIYDGTGESGTDNLKYTWRLRTGGPDAEPDPLIEESIHRRLAGMPDVSAGNQEEVDYTTIDGVIAGLDANDDSRSGLYSSLLSARKTEAEDAAPADGVPDYRFTPAYRMTTMIVFDNMPLADFGNRIPNLTAEIVWAGATPNDGKDTQVEEEAEALPVATDVTEIASTPVPDGFMAVDPNSRRAFAHIDGTLRRFNAPKKEEDRQKEIPDTSLSAIGSYWSSGTYELVRLLGVDTAGNVIGVGTEVGGGGFLTKQTLLVISPSGLEVVGPSSPFPDTTPEGSQENQTEWSTATGEILYGTRVRIGGTYPAHTDPLTGEAGDTGAGEHFVLSRSNGVLDVVRMVDGDVKESATFGDSDATNPENRSTNYGFDISGTPGPMVGGRSDGDGKGTFYISRHSGASPRIARMVLTNTAITSGFGSPQGDNLTITNSLSGWGITAFSSTISYCSALVYDFSAGVPVGVYALSNGSTGVVRLNEDGQVDYQIEIPNVTPPLETSGLTHSDVSNGTLAFADGLDIIAISIYTGEYKIYEGILSSPASNKAQVYVASVGGLFLWEGAIPRVYSVGDVFGGSRDHNIADLLPEVLASICRRAGMQEDEFDVTGVAESPVRGYSIGRPSSGRQVIESLLQAYFVDGVESDWAVAFRDRTSTPLRVIDEKELGSVGGPTGEVNWLEKRVPEYEIPGEINVNYTDPQRDYQNNTSHRRRISNPTPSMFSNSVQNVELPIVFKEHEANSIAERLLYSAWLNRTISQTKMNWGQADLDPGDVVSVKFKDGRILTDRLAKATMGANFEIEMETIRSGDPVFDPAPQSIISSGSIPTVTSPAPVNSEMFIFDIPLLYDYHETGRSALRYYTAVGSDDDAWRSATVFRSVDNNSFTADTAVTLEATYGDVLTVLPPPRALWATDRDNTLTVSIAKDNGDVNSVTREEILNGANRALIYNRNTGLGEIIQFQNVEVSDEGSTLVLSTLIRGVRGTEYAVDKHGLGETFILLDEPDVQVGTFDLAILGSETYFKAVSAGQLIGATSTSPRQIKGRSLMPYAPSRVRREDDGSDLTITWNRRTRVGGSWITSADMEVVPLSEDFEQYEIYLLPSGDAARDAFNPAATGTYLEKAVVSTPSHTFSAATLSAHGIALTDDINVAVYQVSAQVGRGFAAIGPLAP